VRYHACWIEAVSPNEKKVNQVVKKAEDKIKIRMNFKTN
jgi:hypothetical protein